MFTNHLWHILELCWEAASSLMVYRFWILISFPLWKLIQRFISSPWQSSKIAHNYNRRFFQDPGCSSHLWIFWLSNTQPSPGGDWLCKQYTRSQNGRPLFFQIQEVRDQAHDLKYPHQELEIAVAQRRERMHLAAAREPSPNCSCCLASGPAYSSAFQQCGEPPIFFQ